MSTRKQHILIVLATIVQFAAACQCGEGYVPINGTCTLQDNVRLCNKDLLPLCECPADHPLRVDVKCYDQHNTTTDCVNQAAINAVNEAIAAGTLGVKYCECPETDFPFPIKKCIYCKSQLPTNIPCGAPRPPYCRCGWGSRHLLGKYNDPAAAMCMKISGMKKHDCKNRDEIDEYVRSLRTKGINTDFF